MRLLVLFVEPLPCHQEERDRCLEDPGHPQELKEELIRSLWNASRGADSPSDRSSGDPFLPLAGSHTFAGTEVVLSIPPARILQIVLPFQDSVDLEPGSSPEHQSSSLTTVLPWWNSMIVLRLVSRNSNGIGVCPSLGSYFAFLICL
eukprot:s4243_g3.t1